MKPRNVTTDTFTEYPSGVNKNKLMFNIGVQVKMSKNKKYFCQRLRFYLH